MKNTRIKPSINQTEKYASMHTRIRHGTTC